MKEFNFNEALEAEIESHLSQKLRKRKNGKSSKQMKSSVEEFELKAQKHTDPWKNSTAYITRRDSNNISPETVIVGNYTSGVKVQDLYNTPNKSFLSKDTKRAISADGFSRMPKMGVVV
jgi:GH18 family chitinase